MVFKPRLEEAQRHARNEMKTLMDDRGKKGSVLKGRHTARAAGGKRRHDGMDAEEGQNTQAHVVKGSPEDLWKRGYDVPDQI